jgi:excisionase family DNA binding protein
MVYNGTYQVQNVLFWIIEDGDTVSSHYGVQPKLNTIEQASDRLGICRANLYKLLGSGQLRSVKIGRRRLVPEQAIADFIADLEAAGGIR